MTVVGEQTYRIMEEIREEARMLRKQRPQPNLAEWYQQLLDKPNTDEVRLLLRISLRDEYVMQGRFEAATAMALEDIAERPNHPMPLLSLAGQKHHHEGDPGSALPLALKAVALADDVREFRRHARATLLRIAADLGDLQTVRNCMFEIINLDLARGEPDVGREADLLGRAKQVGVEEQILAQYQAFLMPKARR
jgi:hypothetical protein